MAPDPSPVPPEPDDALVLDPDCRRCPALAEARDRIAWGNGPRDAAVMVVGEAPAAGDPDDPEWPGGNRSGLAYTSRHSGRRIRSLLASVGVVGRRPTARGTSFRAVDDAFYTNAVKCFPSDGDGSNREPTPTERSNCRNHLRAEIETIDPAVVLPTGKHATTSLLAAEDRTLDGFLESVLDPIDCPSLGVTAIPLLHPSYADVWRARLGYDRESYREALAAALRSCGVTP
ncbi:uracil-DNA glycosylase [Haloplanus rubicundus]|uniref:Uracil-DNA glycosylase n=1 Tax=Haloplanus rubicundus TaxID=1547898 RepID=A0A345E932_9EURY|nr:uracil-DNA glycosylase family protein [Haloplanus rubicundus]AXG05348.1 uracil-DNA glycosylase [Haloplanus rubicundus]AXG08704.1 uracil-DNA glycosylase [Haloplanus rubicundus]